jgi:hypothetical protein
LLARLPGKDRLLGHRRLGRGHQRWAGHACRRPQRSRRRAVFLVSQVIINEVRSETVRAILFVVLPLLYIPVLAYLVIVPVGQTELAIDLRRLARHWRANATHAALQFWSVGRRWCSSKPWRGDPV